MVDLTRRGFLKGLGVTLGLAASETSGLTHFLSPSTAQAQSNSGQYDVSYCWVDKGHLDDLLDYREEVAEQLGPQAAEDLKIVRRTNNGWFGLIYDRDGPKATAELLARRHSGILTAADLDSAIALKDEGYDFVYNVSYGAGPNLDALKKTYATVYAQLGNTLGKDLVIEQRGEGNLAQYALVYQRRGTLEEVRRTVSSHKKKLESLKIDVSFTAEKGHEEVYGESNYLSDHEDKPRARLSSSRNSKSTRTVSRSTDSNVRKVPHKATVPVKSTRSQSYDESLEDKITDRVTDLRKRGRIGKDETTAWYVYDLKTNSCVACINEDKLMQAASMVKPFVALAYFHQLGAGKIKGEYTAKDKKNMERMIQKSSNSATNYFIGKCGGAKAVDRIVKQYGFDRDVAIVERIPAGGRTYRNKITAEAYGTFLRKLWDEELPYSRELKRVMALPGRDRIYSGVSEIPSCTLVYNKTGSTSQCCGDMGILSAKEKDGDRHPYIMVGIVNKASRTGKYTSWIRSRGNAIREISGVVYTHMKEKYKLM